MPIAMSDVPVPGRWGPYFRVDLVPAFLTVFFFGELAGFLADRGGALCAGSVEADFFLRAFALDVDFFAEAFFFALAFCDPEGVWDDEAEVRGAALPEVRALRLAA